MIATKRVVNTENRTVGYIMIDGRFFSVESTKKIISLIGNLRLTKEGTIRADRKLQDVRWTTLMEAKSKEIESQNKFKRDVQQDFKYWFKQANKKVLLVEGPREVGKTTEVLKFAYKNYSYVIHFDTEKFEAYYGLNGMKDILKTLTNEETMLTGMKNICKALDIPDYLDNRKTVFIIDNIQRNKEMQSIIVSMRRKLKCDIIVINSGGQGTVNLNTDVMTIRIGTMSFKEFCYALDKGDKLDSMKAEMQDDIQLLWKVYLDIGGYPYAVNQFVCGKTNAIRDYQYHIEAQFESDASKEFYGTPLIGVFNLVWALIKSDFRKGDFPMTGRIIDRVLEHSNRIGLNVKSTDVSLVLAWIGRYGIIGEIEVNPVKSVYTAINKWKQYNVLYIKDAGLLSNILEVYSVDRMTQYEIKNKSFTLNELMRIYKRPKYDKKVAHKAPKLIWIDNEYKMIVQGIGNTYTSMFNLMWYKEGKVTVDYMADTSISEEKSADMMLNSLAEKADIDRNIISSIRVPGYQIAYWHLYRK